jgi:hypothetical protein
MTFRTLCGTGFTALMLLGCASAHRPDVIDDEAVDHWAGNLQPTQQRSGALVVTSQNRAFGTVTMHEARAGNLDRVHVALSVSVPPDAGPQLRWAVLPDRCGSGDLPLIGFDQFPRIDVGTNGRGQVSADVPLVLQPMGTYHVNVYSGGQQLDNVITCANLKFVSHSR